MTKKYGWKYWQEEAKREKQSDQTAQAVLLLTACALWGVIIGQVACIVTR